MKYEEIFEVLKSKCNVSSVAYGDFNSIELGLGECQQDVFTNGGEGLGEDWRRVHWFKDHDVFIEMRAWYQSYDGCTFDGWDEACKEVRPKEKMITVYE